MSRARRVNATAIAPIDVSRGAEVGAAKPQPASRARQMLGLISQEARSSNQPLLATCVSCRVMEFRDQRQLGRKCLLGIIGLARTLEPGQPAQSPPIRGHSAAARKSRLTWDCLVLYLRCVSCRETEFRDQRQLGRKCLLGIIGLCRNSNPSGGARQFGAIRQQPGDLA